ncbi:MAG: hypothetical protein LBR53_06720 [Deltaproteobacteria bacterium]|jgi:hypothetical protein|nr:hypothetical protein [Deltaproteobacteria bacterium]
MFVKNFRPLKTAFALALFAFTLVLAQAFTGGTALAQAQPDTKSVKFPILQDQDFQLFLSLLESIEKTGDVADFLKANPNVDEDHMQAVFMKISANTISQVEGADIDLTDEYDDSILFTPEEDKIFEKYKDKITDTFIRIGLNNQDSGGGE